MIKDILLIAEFMQKFNQPARFSPATSLDKNVARLRDKLMEEEVSELTEAYQTDPNFPHLVDIDPALALDALVDQFYVWAGTVLTYGLANYMELALEIIHKSNMSKLWSTEQVKKAKEKHADLEIEQVENNLFIVTDQNGKVIKPPTYIDAYPLLRDMMDEACQGQELFDFSTPPTVFDETFNPDDYEEEEVPF